MRIVHIIPGLTLENGGPAAVLRGLVHYQAEAGHEVTVLTTDLGARHGEQPLVLQERVTLRRLPVQGPDRIAYAPGFAQALRQQLQCCDIVHAHTIFTYPIHAGLREAAAVGVPIVLCPHGTLHRYSLGKSRLPKWIYLTLCGEMVRRACSAWHYTSEQERTESWPGTPASNFVVPNGIEPAEYNLSRPEARRLVHQAWPELQEAPYVLFLGRLHPKKRPDLLVEAFLRGAPPEFRLVVVGPDSHGLWSTIAAQYLSEATAAGRVHYLGTVGGRRKIALLTSATLFALPSEHENFGIAAVEALAAGTSLLLSPHVDFAPPAAAVGLADIVPLDVTAWSAALATLLPDRQRQEKVSAQGPAWVRERYAWRPIAEETVRRYEWVRAGCPPETPLAPAVRLGQGCETGA